MTGVQKVSRAKLSLNRDGVGSRRHLASDFRIRDRIDPVWAEAKGAPDRMERGPCLVTLWLAKPLT